MASACPGGSALGNYVMNEEKGFELDRNLLCGENGREIMQEMKIIQDLNQNATNKTFTMVISPDIKDGEKLSKNDMKEIARDFMKRLGIDPEKQQFLAYVHTEKDHKHIHIIANRVQENGKLIPDNHIGKRAQWIGHGIAKERGLVSAKEKSFENIKTIALEKDVDRGIKNGILQKHKLVMSMDITSMEQYQKQMKNFGVIVKPYINKQGQIQGHRMLDLKSGKDFKASDIHRSMGLKNIMEKGVPFKQKDISLHKSLIPVQNFAINLSLKIVKAIAKQVMSQGMGY